MHVNTIFKNLDDDTLREGLVKSTDSNKEVGLQNTYYGGQFMDDNTFNTFLSDSNKDRTIRTLLNIYGSDTEDIISMLIIPNMEMMSNNLRNIILCAYLDNYKGNIPQDDPVKMWANLKPTNYNCNLNNKIVAATTTTTSASASTTTGNDECFIGSSLVLMADYTTKEIKDVKIDDMVISVKTGLPQKILLIDIPPITPCELYGLNEYEPFATTNHPFISHDNKLLVVDTKSAINISKHSIDDVKEIKINDILLTFDEKVKQITVENITFKKYNDIQLYNIITEDHTFFVNNFGVHDNSFNYDVYKTESLRIGLMVLLVKDIINEFTFEELFNKYHQEVMNIQLNMDDYYEYFNQVVELCHNQKCLDFLYYLWCNKFDLFQ
jgi:hypothetical protein